MNTASQVLFTCAVIVGFSLSVAAEADVVKMSNSGLCHPPQSIWYERTKSYQAFDSLQTCLESGGELPKGVSLLSVSESQENYGEYRDYERTAFGSGWDDSDRDCKDTRAEALIATSTAPVRFAKDKRCRVVTGRWISPFSNRVILNSNDIDIDHVVPLAWSWERGASGWSQEKRERFANDQVNLLPVEASLNRSKGARGPDQWLPPTGQCGYVARFFRIVKMYRLTPKPSEAKWIKSFLDGCRN